MSEAAGSLGRSILLPDTPQVTRSDVGAVWMNHAAGQTAVAVTFPSQRLILTYERPAIHDPLAYVKESVNEVPGSQLIWLSGVPAWAIPEPSDGSNWRAIQFVASDTTITLMGHRSESSLRAIAQSIVDRAG